MLFLAAALLGPALVEAERILPHLPALSSHGVSGVGTFGGVPSAAQTVTAMHAAAKGASMAAEARVPLAQFKAPFGPRGKRAFAGREFEEAQPVRYEETDQQRITGRGGAPVEWWRVDWTDSEPKVVKRLSLLTDAHRVAAKNEIQAIIEMEGEGVFLSPNELWMDSADPDDVGVGVSTENYAGTLANLLNEYQGQLDAIRALDLFIDVSNALSKLREKGIAHAAPTLADVLIVGNLRALGSCHAVLCSSVANTNIKVGGEGGESVEAIVDSDFKSLSAIFLALFRTLEPSQADKLVLLLSEEYRKGGLADSSVGAAVAERAEQIREALLRTYGKKPNAGASALKTPDAVRQELISSAPKKVRDKSEDKAAADEKVSGAPATVFGASRDQLDFAGRQFEMAEPLRYSETDNQRIKNRGGAPVETWRVSKRSNPTIVKRLSLQTDEDRFAARNEIQAIIDMEGKHVFPAPLEIWMDSDDLDDMGVAVSTENYAGTLEALLQIQHGKLEAIRALDFFIEISNALDALRENGIAHESPNLDEVLILGNMNALPSCRAVLISSLANTDIRIGFRRSKLKQLLRLGAVALPEGRVMSKRNMMKADRSSLSKIFLRLYDALEASEAEKLFPLLKEAYGKGGHEDDTVGGVVASRAEHIREELLRTYRRPARPVSSGLLTPDAVMEELINYDADKVEDDVEDASEDEVEAKVEAKAEGKAEGKVEDTVEDKVQA